MTVCYKSLYCISGLVKIQYVAFQQYIIIIIIAFQILLKVKGKWYKDHWYKNYFII